MRNSELAKKIEDLRIMLVLQRDATLKVIKAFDADKSAVAAMKDEIDFLRQQIMILLGHGPGRSAFSVETSDMIPGIPIPSYPDDLSVGDTFAPVDRNSNDPKDEK